MMFLRKIRIVLFGLCCVAMFPIMTVSAASLQLNEDGRRLIQEARQAYDSDMRDRPVLVNTAVQPYVEKIAQRLVPKDKNLPEGVALHATVVETPQPELYAYMDGHLVISTGLLFGLENESQLAGMLAPQIAHLTEGYYLALYQQIKAAQRREKRKAVAGALFGVLLDTAVDYAVEVQSIEMTEEIMSGEATYGETMRRLAALEAGQKAYYGIKDVISSIPDKDNGGRAIDPRLKFEPLADAQGMVYTALAGYDPAQSARACSNAQQIRQHLLQEQERAMGAFAEQLRLQRGLMEENLKRLQQLMGQTGLVQTPSRITPSRAQYLHSLMRLAEVKAATGAGTMETGTSAYRAFLTKVLLPRAQQALSEARYEAAYRDFSVLYERGVHTAPVAFGMAKSRLGDFAFGASPAELKAAEQAYREAIRIDPGYAESYRGLAELYSDTDDYEKAVEAWRAYLKRAPRASDRNKIERQIKILQRKAQR